MTGKEAIAIGKDDMSNQKEPPGKTTGQPERRQNILVTGGAGYIGSFMVDRLVKDGHSVFVADSLENGHSEAVNKNAQLIKGNLRDEKFVEEVFSRSDFDGVIHFGGYISVPESTGDPAKYFRNNFGTTINILEEMKRRKVNNIIFSSTAAVYGNPERVPIPEDHPTKPTNPYGESKLMTERALYWYNNSFGINYTALRYFNASGAALDGSSGESHEPETHIIPNAIKTAIEGGEFTLFGTDYDTKDGTCVRDYIHVLDLIDAHVLALQMLQDRPGGYIFNVGTGEGNSNREVIETVQEITGKKLKVNEAKRRPGDSGVLVADATRIKQELGFRPKHSNLKTIVETAWKWHSK